LKTALAWLLRVGSSRRAAASLGGTALAVSLILTIGPILFNFYFGLPGDDSLVKINTLVATAGFLLIFVTLLVALLTYLTATGEPKLEPEIFFRFSDKNAPVFQAERLEHTTRVVNFRQVEGGVLLRNSSRYPARNPGVRIQLVNMGCIAPQSGWATTVTVNQLGPIEFQWDGGADFSVHGHWTRTLPALDFANLEAFDRDARIVVSVAADGWGPRSWTLPVRLLEQREYEEYSAERARKYRDA
jgi:hypothetical protein